MRNLNRVMAVMTGVRFGNRDIGQPCLWFASMTSDGTGALQVLIGQEALDLIKESGVYDINELEGKTCWIVLEGMSMKFDGLTRIGLNAT